MVQLSADREASDREYPEEHITKKLSPELTVALLVGITKPFSISGLSHGSEVLQFDFLKWRAP